MPSFLHVGGVRHHESKVSCQGTQHNDPNITGPKPGPLNKESIALITRPQHLLHCKVLSLTFQQAVRFQGSRLLDVGPRLDVVGM